MKYDLHAYLKKEKRMIRLDKFLAEMGVGTRSQVKQFLKKRMVAVNGKTDCRPEQKIDPQTDTVCFEGKPIVYEIGRAHV